MPHGHDERVTVDGETEPVVVKLGVWNSSTAQGRNRLTPNSRPHYRQLGIAWT